MITKHSAPRSGHIIAGYLITLFIAGILLPIAINGQRQGNGTQSTKPKTDVQKFKDVKTWYLYFKVTVKGQENNSLPENGGYESISWKFDDTISGNIALDTQTPYTKKNVVTPNMSRQQQMAAVISQIDNLIQWTHIPVGVQRVGPFNGLTPLHIKIDELLIVNNRDPCGDPTKTTTHRFGEGDDFSYQAPFLQTDLGSLTYNVLIPFKSEGDENKLTVTQETEEKIDGKVQKDTTKRDVPFKFFPRLPPIKILLDSGKIHHQTDRPLDAVSNSWEFDSGEMEPDEPLISNLPDSKTKVKIRVYYKLSRTPVTVGN